MKIPQIRLDLSKTMTMFTKDEEKEIKLQFWHGLTQELNHVKGLHANKVNWTNFNTSIRHMYFRMEADENGARLCIDLQFPDQGIRELFYEQFTEFSNILNKRFEDRLIWLPTFQHWNGKTISRIYVGMEGNFYDRSQWPEMFTFLTQNFTILEAFWSEFGDVFKNMK
jgi:hypothetical protein